MVRGFEPRVGLCTDSTEPTWDSLPLLCLSPPLMHILSLSLSQNKYINLKKKKEHRGAWVAYSVKCSTLAQVTISRFVGSSPTSGSVLRAQSLEPALDSVSPSLSLSLSAPPLLMLCLSQK